MKRRLLTFVVVALVAGPVFAANKMLWEDKRCNACHALDRKLVGPAFRDIAKRYGGNPAMIDPLAYKIVNGGAGAWGSVPMTANRQVSEAEARELAAWVLSLKP